MAWKYPCFVPVYTQDIENISHHELNEYQHAIGFRLKSNSWLANQHLFSWLYFSVHNHFSLFVLKSKYRIFAEMAIVIFLIAHHFATEEIHPDLLAFAISQSIKIRMGISPSCLCVDHVDLIPQVAFIYVPTVVGLILFTPWGQNIYSEKHLSK